MIAGISGEGAIEKQWGARGRETHLRHPLSGDDIIEERVRKYAIDCDLKHGWMEVSARPSHQARTIEHYESLVKEGAADSFELVDKPASSVCSGQAPTTAGSST